MEGGEIVKILDKEQAIRVAIKLAENNLDNTTEWVKPEEVTQFIKEVTKFCPATNSKKTNIQSCPGESKVLLGLRLSLTLKHERSNLLILF